MKPIVVGIAAILLIVILGWFAYRNRSGLRSVEKLAGPIGSQEADDQVFKQLKKVGADLTKPTEVNFYLYLPTREAADRVAAQAEDHLLKATVRPGAGEGQTNWLCFLTGHFVPTDEAIHGYSLRFTEFAKHENGEYDGWEAAVTK
jgi:hypothetical protein